jgi:hypothetical protein
MMPVKVLLGVNWRPVTTNATANITAPETAMYCPVAAFHLAASRDCCTSARNRSVFQGLSAFVDDIVSPCAAPR